MLEISNSIKGGEHMVDAEEFIQHYGKKGMRWGVRNKAKTAIKSRSAAKKERTSSDYKDVSNLRGKHPSKLSNADLKKINERMNLEQNYNRLNAGKVRSGKAKAELIVGTVGVGVGAYNVLHSPAGKAAKELGKKLINTAIEQTNKTWQSR